MVKIQSVCKSGAKAAAVQTLARMPGPTKSREAFGAFAAAFSSRGHLDQAREAFSG
jgi:hypothetical protein